MATTKHGEWSQPTSQADQAATLEDSNMDHLGYFGPKHVPPLKNNSRSRSESSFIDERSISEDMSEEVMCHPENHLHPKTGPAEWKTAPATDSDDI